MGRRQASLGTPVPRTPTPREGLQWLLLKMGRTRPLVEPRRGPQAGKSGDPRSQNADKAGLLSIATQEPNWPRSPSPLGLVLVIRTTQRRLRYARGRALLTQNNRANGKVEGT